MLKKIVAVLVLVLSFMVPVASSATVSAAACPTGSIRPTYNKVITECNMPLDKDTPTGNKSVMDIVKNVINVVLGLVGIVAVVVIIIGGFTFLTSQGDAAKVAKGRNTLLYGVVGMVIAILAFAIVNFVLGGVFG